MKKLSILFVLIFLLSCSLIEIVNNETATDILNKSTEEIFIEEESGSLFSDETGRQISDNTEIANLPPCMTELHIIWSDNMKNFKAKFENSSFDETELRELEYFPKDENGMLYLNSDNLLEIRNIPHGYSDVHVEWQGERYYSITYANKDNEDEEPFTFYICFDEERVYEWMAASLKDVGRYEELNNNDLISNLRRETIETKFGEGELCIYDTSVNKNYKTLYLEFETNDKKYVISESYNPDNSLSYSIAFVFDGDKSFILYNFNGDLSYESATSYELY